MPIAVFDSGTIPRDRGAELEAAVVAAGRHLTRLFEGWIAAAADRRKFAVRITSYPELDVSVRFDWNASAAEVTERVRATQANLSVAATRERLFGGSKALWPLSGVMMRSASGHSRCSAQALSMGQTTS